VERYPEALVAGDILTLLLWDLSGRLVGYQVYSYKKGKQRDKNPHEQRYFTKTKYSLAVWGLSVLDPWKRHLFLCEGVFDACRLHTLGLNAVALLGATPRQEMYQYLLSLGYSLVMVAEGDQAGRRGAKLSMLQNVMYLPEGKDLGGLTEEELLHYFKEYL
jgi:DNA primase